MEDNARHICKGKSRLDKIWTRRPKNAAFVVERVECLGGGVEVVCDDVWRKTLCCTEYDIGELCKHFDERTLGRMFEQSKISLSAYFDSSCSALAKTEQIRACAYCR